MKQAEITNPKLQEFEDVINENGKANLSWTPERVEFNDLEKVFSEHWQKENKKRAGINYGWGILQDLFFKQIGLGCLQRPKCMLVITNRDRLIAATVIQWLGTNVGFCFLNEVLRKAGYSIVKNKPND